MAIPRLVAILLHKKGADVGGLKRNQARVAGSMVGGKIFDSRDTKSQHPSSFINAFAKLVCVQKPLFHALCLYMLFPGRTFVFIPALAHLPGAPSPNMP